MHMASPPPPKIKKKKKKKVKKLCSLVFKGKRWILALPQIRFAWQKTSENERVMEKNEE